MNAGAEARQARQHADLLEACAPLMEELDAAKQAVRDAKAGGDEGAVAEATQRFTAAGQAVREVRCWLRAERHAAEHAATIDDLSAKPHLSDGEQAALAAALAELPRMEALAAPYRQAAAAFGVPGGEQGSPSEPGPGDATVNLPAAGVKARAREVG